MLLPAHHICPAIIIVETKLLPGEVRPSCPKLRIVTDERRCCRSPPNAGAPAAAPVCVAATQHMHASRCRFGRLQVRARKRDESHRRLDKNARFTDRVIMWGNSARGE
ncbi:uncharacterized protein LOC105432714 [Pogonomyrmex barbatus]|uniref:Uncharacterized protein LOC105432714 n=1 Tax=Pogonomyrmex barbatus TaxID=144034 RepID=A0A8N1S9H9_9HYME|nr:uncharacterized protein LOC105432714 [Pogonomyrmex barbatus]